MTYVYLIAERNKIGMIFGVLYCAVYGFVSFKANVLGEAFISSVVQGLLCAYGFFTWGKLTDSESGKVEGQNVTAKEIMAIPVIGICIYFLLIKLNSAVAGIDTISTTVALVASYAMAKALKINFILWTIANALNVAVWYVRGVPALSIMFAIFFLNGLYGLYNFYKK